MVEGSHTLLELGESKVTLQTSNWASVWANQTLALPAQNSGSFERGSGCGLGTVNLETRGEPIWREQGPGTNQLARESSLIKR